MRLFSTPHAARCLQVCCMALVVAVMLPSRPVLAHAQGKSRGTPDFVSHDTDRWALDLLPRSRPARRADAAPAARLSLILADVRAALRSTCRALSPGRTRLPGLRTQRLAGPEAVRLHL